MTDLTPSAKLLGTPAFIPRDMVILHNQRIGKVVIKQSGTTLDYLYWVFLTERFKRYMASTATGSTVRHTSPSRIRDYRFPLPPGDEQRRIIEALKTCDRKCDAHECTRSALNTLFRTLLHQLMTAQIRIKDLDLSALGAVAAEPAADTVEVA